ncbi:MAG: hypothetical protein DRN08_07320 [Thermoplasmata archaeon]|nr:MAG: hypothetical protein DRN08_07320 [Thermoplasmata archaeon]
MSQILLTGVAGFIGEKVAELLLKKGYKVVGVDNLNDYYDVSTQERLSFFCTEKTTLF